MIMMETMIKSSLKVLYSRGTGGSVNSLAWDGQTEHQVWKVMTILLTRSLGALRAPTSRWRPFGPLDFVLRALRALRPCDPRNVDQHLLFHLYSHDA